jgi:hypothetical protein
MVVLMPPIIAHHAGSVCLMERMTDGPDLEIASVGRRLAAAGINVGIIGPPLVAGSWIWMKLPPALTRRNPMNLLDLTAVKAYVATDWMQNFNRPSPGERLVRIRPADARTGGPVTLRQALVRQAARGLLAELSRKFLAPVQQRQKEKLDAVQPEVKRIQQEHAGDPEARQKALIAYYKTANVNPLASCAPGLIPHVPAALWTLFSPQHQTPFNQLAKIVVIVERRD